MPPEGRARLPDRAHTVLADAEVEVLAFEGAHLFTEPLFLMSVFVEARISRTTDERRTFSATICWMAFEGCASRLPSPGAAYEGCS